MDQIIYPKFKQVFSLKVFLIGITLLFFAPNLKAQDIDGVHSFLVAGISAEFPKNNKLLIYGGISPTDKAKALVILPNIKINRYLTLTPGYTYVNIKPDNLDAFSEHQLLAAANVGIPISKQWTLVDRNMYYHRFRQEADDLSFYRNRLGIIHHTQLFKKSVNLSLHNEIYLSLNSGQLSRNRVIAMAEIKLFKWLTPQVMYMFQSDRKAKSRHLGWLVFTIPLENFGVFK